MIRFVLKLLALAAIAVLPALGTASVAEATYWTSNGNSAGHPFSYSALASKFTIASPSAPGTTCTIPEANGDLFGPAGPANTGPWNGVGRFVHPVFIGYAIAGLTATVTCIENASWNVASQFGWMLSGSISGIWGTVVRGTCTLTIAGTVPVQYINASGNLTVLASGQSLLASAPAGCDSITGFSGGGTASSTFGANAVPISNLIYPLTSPIFVPDIQHN